MKVMILAAGEGTRTKNIFPDVPKALIPLKRKPFIEYLIKQYKGFQILLNVRAQDAKEFEYLNLPFLVEYKPLGNAGAVKYFIKELGDKFIVTHNDVYSDLKPRKLVRAHKGMATMVAKNVGRPKEFGVVTHEGATVTGFTRERLINCGIYVFSKDVVKYIGKGFQDFDRDLFPNLISKRKLRFYRHEGKWCDIGRAEYWTKGKKR